MKTLQFIFIFNFVICALCSCTAQDKIKNIYPEYSEKEISVLNDKIMEEFGADESYYVHFEKKMPSYSQGALLFAVREKNMYEINRAVKYGAIIDYLYYGGQGSLTYSFTLIDIVISRGGNSEDKSYFDVFKYLKSLGANILNVNDKGSSALMLAVYYENKEVFDYLIEKKIDVNHTDSYNKNALMYAIENSNIYFSKILLALGSEVNLRSKDQLLINISGWTCLDVAIDVKNQDLIDLLKKYGAKTRAELDAEEGK